jgi:hypothetical protein
LFSDPVLSREDWHIDAVKERVNASEKCGNRVVFVGRIPEKGEYPDRVSNRHSGGHYTPRFNEYWAKKMAELMASTTEVLDR